jgi:hypothetical protein
MKLLAVQFNLIFLAGRRCVHDVMIEQRSLIYGQDRTVSYPLLGFQNVLVELLRVFPADPAGKIRVDTLSVQHIQRMQHKRRLTAALWPAESLYPLVACRVPDDCVGAYDPDLPLDALPDLPDRQQVDQERELILHMLVYIRRDPDHDRDIYEVRKPIAEPQAHFQPFPALCFYVFHALPL